MSLQVSDIEFIALFSVYFSQESVKIKKHKIWKFLEQKNSNKIES